MALFEVPGWSVPDAPVPQLSGPRKRKRTNDAPSASSSSSKKMHSAVQNVEKLIAALDRDTESGVKKQRKNKKKETRASVSDVPSPRQMQGKDVKKKHAREPKPTASSSHGSSGTGEPSGRTPQTKKKNADNSLQNHKSRGSSLSTEKGKDLTTLQANMKQSLDGARFRWINEELYKSDSARAHDMMRENPKVFSEYHSGFRHQVHSWPDNPVSHYIAALSSRPVGTVVADLGCGDAALAKDLVPLGLTVLSYDLVSDDEFVIEADICQRLPLPGSIDEGKAGGAQVVDVVVCALSLMSTNWIGCIREAWRVLKPNSELKIAEVTSRFTDLEAFISLVSSVGFKLRSKDESNSHFTLLDFVKVSRKPKSDKEWEKLMTRGSILKPCEYKRR